MFPQMRNAPGYFTIAQVRFNPILSLSTFLPGIQENLRKHGFADFKKAVVMTFAFTPVVNKEAESQVPPAQPLERFIFADTENTQNFLLDHGALSFQSTKYEVFETFSAELMRGVELLDRMVGGLSFVERIGLRYLDAIMPHAGENLSQYLIPEAGLIRTIERTNETHLLGNDGRKPRRFGNLSRRCPGRPGWLSSGSSAESAQDWSVICEFQWRACHTRY